MACALLLASAGCSSGRYTTMYLDRLVHERAEQEVKLETMALDLEAAHNTITTLEMENQRLREASGELDAKPVKRRRVSDEPDATPLIDKEPSSQKPRNGAAPTDEVTSAPDSIPELDIVPMDEDASPSGINAKHASLKRPEEKEAAPDVFSEGDGNSFMPSKGGASQAEPSEEELPPPDETDKPAESAAAPIGAAMSIVFDKTQTRGVDLDGRPGDEGVLVVLQPRDGAGRYLAEPASVLIEVVDSPTASKADSSAQVAEWKFTREEVRRAMRNSTLGRGAFLQVDWDEHLPSHSKLLIIAHWKSPSGEELTTEHVVKVNLSRGAQARNSRLNGPSESDEPAVSVATRPSSRDASTSNKSWTPSRR